MNHSILDWKLSDESKQFYSSYNIPESFWHKRFYNTNFQFRKQYSNPACVPRLCPLFYSLSCTVKSLQPFHESHCLLITQQRCFASDEGTHSFVLPHKCWAWRCPSQSLTQVSLPDSSPGNLQEFASKRRASIQRVPLRQAALLYTSSGRIQDLIRGLL